MTFYYIAVEDELAPASPPPAPSPAFGSSTMADIAPGAMPANDNASASAASASAEPRAIQAAEATAATDATDGPTRVPMLGRDCQPLAEVTPEFAASVRMQGTGRLRDGRLINVAGACSCGVQCFHILPPAIKWGTGSSGLPLSPFRMVAVDPTVIKMGSLLYIPELDGMRMPGRAPTGGFIHDGCVVAADVGGRIKGNQLDFFVARRAYYDGLARRGTAHGWATHVEVWDGSARCTRRGSRVSRSAAGSI
ncbi:MAG TPA: 3D domain-containing protein [Kofleriaceae bacterium]|nr:3D domain-containing protein [Kofleriaceae bacterium]